MSQTRRLIRQTMTIARRDFIATVFTPIFLLFLFAPLIMVAFSTIGAMGAAQAADHGTDRVRIVAIVPDATATAFVAADRQSRTIFRRDEEPPKLVTLPPTRDPAAQARAAFESPDYDATAVLYGPLDRPTILYGARGTRAADYLACWRPVRSRPSVWAGNCPRSHRASWPSRDSARRWAGRTRRRRWRSSACFS